MRYKLQIEEPKQTAHRVVIDIDFDNPVTRSEAEAIISKALDKAISSNTDKVREQIELEKPKPVLKSIPKKTSENPKKPEADVVGIDIIIEDIKENGLTLMQASDKYGIAKSTLYNKLQNAGFSFKTSKSDKPRMTVSEVQFLYGVKGYNLSEIAKHYSTNVAEVRKFCADNRILKRINEVVADE